METLAQTLIRRSLVVAFGEHNGARAVTLLEPLLSVPEDAERMLNGLVAVIGPEAERRQLREACDRFSAVVEEVSMREPAFTDVYRDVVLACVEEMPKVTCQVCRQLGHTKSACVFTFEMTH